VIRFTEEAQADLVEIAAWLGSRNPLAADRVIETILADIEQLGHFPLIGHAGRVPDTRELVISGLPYVVIYKPLPDLVAVLRILHGAMQWPQLDEL
jgi:toxin ParE1/3/4